MLCCITSATRTQPPDQNCIQPPFGDAAIVELLMMSWSLLTDRAIPHGVPVDELSPESLIGFWADPAFADA